MGVGRDTPCAPSIELPPSPIHTFGGAGRGAHGVACPTTLPAPRALAILLDKWTLFCKAWGMETNWAVEHIQVIRTLMERAALYRRALAPVMLLAGSVGVLGAGAGWLAPIELPRSFALYWLVIGAATVAGVYVLIRAQALKDSEPFWSPPTRRVTQALLPALAAGLFLTVALCFGARSARLEGSMTIYATNLGVFVWLPALWIVLYGCAIHAAGFFMPRGMKLFGWVFILGGCSLFWLAFQRPPTCRLGHGLMGAFFGVLHLAYGVYLYFTERDRKTA
jgi:hypothetical protein